MTKQQQALDLIGDTTTHGYYLRHYSSEAWLGPFGQRTKPEPGTTICIFIDTFGCYAEWLRKEDRERSRKDMDALDELLPALTKAQLTDAIKARHGYPYGKPDKRSLVRHLLLIMLRRWWPVRVADERFS